MAGKPMNAATNRFTGRWKSCLRRRALVQHAVAQHGDARAERHRLDLVRCARIETRSFALRFAARP